MNIKTTLMRNAMEELEQSVQPSSEPLSETDKTKHQESAVSADEQKPHREDEIVFYAKMSNPDGLKLASAKESQEQWEVKTQKGKVRVRKTTIEGLEPTYEMTFKTKSKNAGLDGSIEQTNPCNEGIFNSFKQIANNGMIKDRYKFPVTSVQIKTEAGVQDVEVQDVFYEVDVFFNHDETYSLFVKIDLEMNPILDALKVSKPDLGDFKLNVKLMDLPFKPIEVIINTQMSDEDKSKVDQLYEEVFLTKNKD